MEKFLSDFDAVDFDDLGNDFQGVTLNKERWERYQTIVKNLFAAQEEDCGIVKINYIKTPEPHIPYADAVAVISKAASFDGNAKAALIQAASMCDRIVVTASGDQTRVGFVVSNIWKC